MHIFKFYIILNIFITISLAYKAAVVEYVKTSFPADRDLEFNLNLQKYIDVLNNVKNDNLDIIVFPEMTLNDVTHVLNEKNYLSELDDLINTIREVKVYTVINIFFTNDTKIYNKNLVFNRNGDLISQYNKYNLYYTDMANKPDTLKIETFDTDFNVTFGHIVCFDLLKKHPIYDLVYEHNVTNLIYPSLWFSQLPFLTSLQAYQAFSYYHNVNLLAAGTSSPSVGASGSGIFNGKCGLLTSIISHLPSITILIANVSEITPNNLNNCKNHLNNKELNDGNKSNNTLLNNDITKHPFGYFDTNNILKLHENEYIHTAYLNNLLFKHYNTLQFNFNEEIELTGEQNIKKCIDNFCCEVYINSFKNDEYTNNDNNNNNYDSKRSIKLTRWLRIIYLMQMKNRKKKNNVSYKPYYRLRMVMVNDMQSNKYGNKICGVVACYGDELDTCGYKHLQYNNIDKPYTIKNLKISVKLQDNDATNDIDFLPNTLTTSFVPMQTNSFEYDVNEKSLKLVKERNDLYTFALYGY